MKYFIYTILLISLSCRTVHADSGDLSAPIQSIVNTSMNIPQMNYPLFSQNIYSILTDDNLTWNQESNTNIQTCTLPPSKIFDFTFQSFIYKNIETAMLKGNISQADSPYSSTQKSVYPTNASIITSRITGFKKYSVYKKHVDYSSPFFNLIDDQNPTVYYAPVGETIVQNSGYKVNGGKPFNFYTRLSFYSSENSQQPEAVYYVKNGTIPQLYNSSNVSAEKIEWSPAYITKPGNISTYTWTDSPVNYIPGELIEALPYVKIENIVDYGFWWQGGNITTIQPYIQNYVIEWAKLSSAALGFLTMPVLDWINSTKNNPPPTPWGQGQGGLPSDTIAQDTIPIKFNTENSYYIKLYDLMCKENQITECIYLPYVNSNTIGAWLEIFSYFNATVYYLMELVYTDINFFENLDTIEKCFSSGQISEIISGVQYIQSVLYTNIDLLTAKPISAAWCGFDLYNIYIQSEYHWMPDAAWGAFSRQFGILKQYIGEIQGYDTFIEGAIVSILDGIIVFTYPASDPSGLVNNTKNISYENLFDNMPTPNTPASYNDEPLDYYLLVDQWFWFGLQKVYEQSSLIMNNTVNYNGTSKVIITEYNVKNFQNLRKIFLIIAYIIRDSNCKYNEACFEMYIAFALLCLDITDELTEVVFTLLHQVINGNPELAKNYQLQLLDIINYLNNYYSKAYSQQLNDMANLVNSLAEGKETVNVPGTNSPAKSIQKDITDITETTPSSNQPKNTDSVQIKTTSPTSDIKGLNQDTATLANQFGIDKLQTVNRYKLTDLENEMGTFSNSITTNSGVTLYADNSAALSSIQPPTGDETRYYYTLRGNTGIKINNTLSNPTEVCTLIYFFRDESSEIPSLIVNANTKGVMFEGYNFVKFFENIGSWFGSVWDDISGKIPTPPQKSSLRYWSISGTKSFDNEWALDNLDHTKYIVLTQAFVNLFPYIEIHTVTQNEMSAIFNGLTGDISVGSAKLIGEIALLVGKNVPGLNIALDVTSGAISVWDDLCSWIPFLHHATVPKPSMFNIINGMVSYLNSLVNWTLLSPYSAFKGNTDWAMGTEVTGIMWNGLWTLWDYVLNDIDYSKGNNFPSNHSFWEMMNYIKNYYVNTGYTEILHIESQVLWTINYFYYFVADSGKVISKDTTNLFKYINYVFDKIEDDEKVGEGVCNILLDTISIVYLSKFAKNGNSEIESNKILFDLYSNGFKIIMNSFNYMDESSETAIMDQVSNQICQIDSKYSFQSMIVMYIIAFMNSPVTMSVTDIAIETLDLFFQGNNEFVSANSSQLINILTDISQTPPCTPYFEEINSIIYKLQNNQYSGQSHSSGFISEPSNNNPTINIGHL